MKEEKLKKFIDEHRDAFDEEGPSEGLWQSISDDLAADGKDIVKIERPAGLKTKRIMWSAAATVAIVIGFSLMNGGSDINPEEISTTSPTAGTVDLAAISTEVAEIDNYYSVQVNKRVNQLSAYELDEELMEELSDLSTEYEGLKKEMGQSFDDSQVLAAMIENYRLRLALLEDLLAVMEKNSGTESTRTEHEF